MVTSRKHVGWRQDLIPPEEGGDESARKNLDGPLYAPADVLALLRKGTSAVNLWTRDCDRDVTVKLEWELADVVDLIRDAVTKGRFKNSEWCIQKPGGPIAPCDAYLLRRKEWNEPSRRELTFEYYVKFAISRTGNLLLVASCHV